MPPTRSTHRTARTATAGTARAWTALLLAAAVAFTLLPLPLGASELTEEEHAEVAGEDDGVRLADGRLVGPADASRRGFWVWPEGRRGFFLGPERSDPFGTGTAGAFEELIAIDLDTGEELGRGRLSPQAWITAGGESRQWASGGDHAIAVDRAGGRLFVPYGIPASQAVPDSALQGRPCRSPAVLLGADPACVGGVHVVDALTLAISATIPLSAPLVADEPGSGGFMPMLRAVRYTPPREGEPGTGKVHLMVEDYQHHLNDGIVTQFQSRGRFQQFSVHWAIQLDVASGTQDWTVRLDACRGSRDSNYYDGGLPFPAAVFRSPHTGDLYVGCSAGSARQAVVVRVSLDAAGRPEPAVVAGDPVAATERLVEAGPGSVGSDDAARRGARQRHWVGPDGGIESMPTRSRRGW